MQERRLQDHAVFSCRDRVPRGCSRVRHARRPGLGERAASSEEPLRPPGAPRRLGLTTESTLAAFSQGARPRRHHPRARRAGHRGRMPSSSPRPPGQRRQVPRHGAARLPDDPSSRTSASPHHSDARAGASTLDCGYQPLPDFPDQQRRVRARRMPELRDVFDLVQALQANDVRLNVETKVEAGAPQETAPRAQFVRRCRPGDPRGAASRRQVTIQSSTGAR